MSFFETVFGFIYTHGDGLINILTTILGLAAIVIAAKGLTTWREQIRYKLDVEICRELLSQISKTRALLSRVPEPYIGPEDEKFISDADESLVAKTWLKKKRYFQSLPAQKQLDFMVRDAGILLADRSTIGRKAKLIRKFVQGLSWKLNKLERLENRSASKLSDEEFDKIRELQTYLEDVFDDNGAFETELDAAFLPLEEFVADRIRATPRWAFN